MNLVGKKRERLHLPVNVLNFLGIVHKNEDRKKKKKLD